MAKIGIKCLTYAPYTSGGDGSAISYGTGVQLLDYMIRADVGEERVDVDFYADDHKIDTENSMTGATVTLELANMTDALEKAMLGYVAENTSSGSDLMITDASAPFVGCGFYRKERFKGAVSYKCYWFYKVQFNRDSDSTTTKGENLDFQTESVNGDALGVQLTSSGPTIYYVISRQSTETAAVGWLKTKAGIT